MLSNDNHTLVFKISDFMSNNSKNALGYRLFDQMLEGKIYYSLFRVC